MPLSPSIHLTITINGVDESLLPYLEIGLVESSALQHRLDKLGIHGNGTREVLNGCTTRKTRNDKSSEKLRAAWRLHEEDGPDFCDR